MEPGGGTSINLTRALAAPVRAVSRIFGAVHEAAASGMPASARSGVVDCAVYVRGERQPGEWSYREALAAVRKRSDAFVWLGLHDPDVTERLERELKREYHIITAEKRLNAIAADFVEHYTTGWETGKAMLVCIDKITCVRMHALITEHWEARIAALEVEHP